jgi:TonB family protein
VSKRLAAFAPILMLSSVTCASHAEARSWPDTAGWTIIEGDDYCGMTLEYEGKGDTQLTVGKFLDGHALVLLTNTGWSAKKDEKYDLSFVIGDAVFGGGVSYGIEDSIIRKGFATQFGAGFFRAFAAGSSFSARMGDTVVDSLQLKGSAAAMVTVDRCLASVRATNAAAEREKKRFAYIADDPFAGPEKEKSASPAGGNELGSSWISDDDYPPSSIRAEEEGTTVVSYTLTADGRVANCAVTSSSGSSALDQATCRAIMRRGRHTPSLDANGNPTATTHTLTRKWKLPTN